MKSMDSSKGISNKSPPKVRKSGAVVVWTAAAAGSRAEPVALATVTEMFFILSAAGSAMKTFLVLFAAPSMMAA